MVFMAGYDFNKDRVFGRIVGLADVFDSLSHWRIYKEKWETDQVIKFIRQGRGKRFAPELVDLFLAHVEEFIAINAAYPDETPA